MNVSAPRSYGDGAQYRRTDAGVWVYAATDEPVEGGVDLRLGRRTVLWAPELHPESLLTAAAAAELAGVQPRSWHRMVLRGQCPAPVLHIERTPVWTVGVVEAWLRTRPGGVR